MSSEDPLLSSIRKALASLDVDTQKSILDSIDTAENLKPEEIYDTGAEYKGNIQQGDIFRDLPLMDLVREKKTDVVYGPCVILSNACDIVPGQKRAIRVTYSPILRLEKYLEVLARKTDDTSVSAGLAASIRKQGISKIMFIPKSDKLDYDGIVALDYVLSAKLKVLFPKASSEKDSWLYSMTMPGWYFFMTRLNSFYFRPTDDQLLLRLGLQHS